ncbi:MBL fold metallo-hydrolase, partial [bacterium M00.F.Ca.ET.156.01.1.1]
MPDLSRRAFASALPFGLLGGGLIHSAQAIAATPEPVATPAS